MFTKPPKETKQIKLELPDECGNCGYRSFDVSIGFSGGSNDRGHHKRVDERRRVIVRCSACSERITEQITEDCSV